MDSLLRRDAIDWLLELTWSNRTDRDEHEDELNGFTDLQIIRLLNKHHSGGYQGFLDTYITLNEVSK